MEESTFDCCKCKQCMFLNIMLGFPFTNKGSLEAKGAFTPNIKSMLSENLGGISG